MTVLAVLVYWVLYFIDNLVIEDIKPEDSGTYQCLAENSASQSPQVGLFVIEVQGNVFVT